MPSMRLLLLAVPTALLLSHVGWADTVAMPTNMKDICASDFEGSFVGRMDDRMDVRINLFCADESRLMGTLAQTHAGELNSFSVNLGLAEIEGDELIVAPFSKEITDHRGKSSANTFNYLRLKLSSFRNHVIDGTFVGYTGNGFHRIHAPRTQTFPKPLALNNGKKVSPRGVYDFPSTPMGRIKMLIDVVHGVPIATFNFQDNSPIHFTNGPLFTDSGTFMLNNSGGDAGEANSKRVFSLRGSFLSDQEVEVSWISPVDGLSNKYRGRLIQDGH